MCIGKTIPIETATDMTLHFQFEKAADLSAPYRFKQNNVDEMPSHFILSSQRRQF